MVGIYAWQQSLREWRHSPCLMKPVTMGMLIIMVLFWLITMALTIPTWILGFLVGPIMARGTWLIEFLYPMPIARWGHLVLLKWSQPKVPLDDKAANYHSRTLEQRVEVVKGRVWVHPIPQLLDNLGYLVVCVPPPPGEPNVATSDAGETPMGRVSVTLQFEPDGQKQKKGPIVAFLVDCGDADTVREQIQLIRETHYPDYPSIQLQMVMSTHKHHDHTAGNEGLIGKDDKIGRHVEHIVGGAVERVPGCTLPVADGDLLKLPACGKNDMNDLVHVEVVAVPAHTRGSVVYLLRPNTIASGRPTTRETHTAPCFAFTGDTMFSGGGGVPFEAGSDKEVDHGAYRDNAQGAIRAGVGSHAVERCFAEILIRGTSSEINISTLADPRVMQDQFLIFPGHEYTTELLSRQFGAPPGGNMNDANKWKNFPPAYFFETVSELYVSLHRRSLPQATGKVLAAAPTTLRKELAINPHLRSLARRAELVVQAIRLWDAYFCKPKSPKGEEEKAKRTKKAKQRGAKDAAGSSLTVARNRKSDKTASVEHSWNMDARDAAKTVFTTVYTADLEDVISDLTNGRIDPEEAASKLEELKSKLQEPVIRRRPIPGTLPSERVVFKGLIGFALLGSRPSAMTLSDSEKMKLPPPAVQDSSCILVSKKRLVAMLGHLGYLDGVDGDYLVDMIHSLWQEAQEYEHGSDSTEVGSHHESKYNTVGKTDDEHDTTDDDEEGGVSGDLVELGTLKWILYGFPAIQPSWFSRFCMPCGMSAADKELLKRQDEKAQEEHPVQVSSMKRRHGELVRHDVMVCMLCRDATGCPDAGEENGEENGEEEEGTEAGTMHYLPHYNGPNKTPTITSADYDPTSEGPDDDSSYVTTSNDSAVEVSTLNSFLHKCPQGMEDVEEKLRI